MRKKLNTCFIMLNFFLAISMPVMAANSVDTDYFKALEQIKKPPIDSVPILACDINKKNRVLYFMNKIGLKYFESFLFPSPLLLSSRLH